MRVILRIHYRYYLTAIIHLTRRHYENDYLLLSNEM